MTEIVAALRTVVNGESREAHLVYQCPACDSPHVLPVEGRPMNWQWNGNLDAPTLTPSVHAFHQRLDGSRETLCHHFLTDGRVVVCGDSPKHPNESLPLPPLPDWLVPESATPHTDTAP